MAPAPTMQILKEFLSYSLRSATDYSREHGEHRIPRRATEKAKKCWAFRAITCVP